VSEGHRVVHGGGAQTLATVPLNRQARPTAATAATFRVVDLRLGEDDPLRLIASGAATLDATTTTTTAAVGLGTARPRELPVASAAGFVQGRRYLVTDASGIRELVRVEGVTTGLVKLASELARKFETGATVRGVEVTCSFPSIEANKDDSADDGGGPYAVDWSWDVDPSPRREIVFIVRVAGTLTITEDQLLAVDPTLTAVAGTRVSLAAAIRTAALEVRAMMQAAQVDPDNFHGSTTAMLAVAYRAAWHVLRHKDGERSDAKAELSRVEAQKHIDSLLVGRPPEKSVSTNPSTDTAPAGSSKHYHHWQVLS
jgi:hypothetical protein